MSSKSRALLEGPAEGVPNVWLDDDPPSFGRLLRVPQLNLVGVTAKHGGNEKGKEERARIDATDGRGGTRCARLEKCDVGELNANSLDITTRHLGEVRNLSDECSRSLGLWKEGFVPSFVVGEEASMADGSS